MYTQTSYQLKRLESVTLSPLYSHFSETVTGTSSVRAYEVNEYFIDTNNKLIDKNNSCHFLFKAAIKWLTLRLQLTGLLILFTTAMFAIYLKQTLSAGIAGLCVTYALQMTVALNLLVRELTEFEMNVVAIERCMDYKNVPEEASWNEKCIKPALNWPDKGVIVFENYSTKYGKYLDLVLKDISCCIFSKEKIGIVGRTGAGKSSLTFALFRLIEPTAGKILIDDVDISKIGLYDLRMSMTIIPQDPVLFIGKLRTNIDPFGQYTDNEIWAALELVRIKTFVSSLNEGLEHDILEGGENMSVGQRQLICLARALLRKTKILLLDEATAAVDPETDEVIQEIIRTAFSDCTVLTIAHRINTVLDYDRIMVLHQGRIVEFDKPSSLLSDKDSYFYSMARNAALNQHQILRKKS